VLIVSIVLKNSRIFALKYLMSSQVTHVSHRYKKDPHNRQQDSRRKIMKFLIFLSICATFLTLIDCGGQQFIPVRSKSPTYPSPVPMACIKVRKGSKLCPDCQMNHQWSYATWREHNLAVLEDRDKGICTDDRVLRIFRDDDKMVCCCEPGTETEYPGIPNE
jgi:hypothetical protein